MDSSQALELIQYRCATPPAEDRDRQQPATPSRRAILTPEASDADSSQRAHGRRQDRQVVWIEEPRDAEEGELW